MQFYESMIVIIIVYCTFLLEGTFGLLNLDHLVLSQILIPLFSSTQATASCSPPGLSLLLGPSLCGQQGTDNTHFLVSSFLKGSSKYYNILKD